MTDKYADLRAALDTGPTPGPWTVDGEGIRALVRGADLTIVAVRHRLPGHIHEANVRLIAAAHPETIRALLAERDAQAAEIEKLKKALRWTAGALQAACQSAYCSDEGDQVTIGAEFKTVSQILDYADAALSGEPNANT